VVAVDNFITGQRRNIEHLAGRPRFEFIEHDVCQPLDVQADLILHLASPASPKGYLKHPVETSMVNAQGTYNLLELARRNRASFLLASTSEVYGEPSEHPQREEYRGNVSCTGIRSCYDEGKRFAESLTMTYYRHHDVNARVIRIFNTYGPRSDPQDGRLVPNFVVHALQGTPIPVYGDGTQTRALCYVSDLVNGILKAALSPDMAGEVVNLGNPDERTVLEYARLIKRLADSPSPIVHVSPSDLGSRISDDPSRRCPDISKARRLLQWEPQVDVEEGLSKTIAWFREIL
jgi:dTDP-glucose 4,6-dehydratase/UDP-glucuronate decarboxylase